MPKLVGDRDQDAAQFKATSPLEQTTRIKQPLLMAYGGADVRVPPVHGEKMRDALKARIRQVEWLEYADEEYGCNTLETTLDFWSRVERLLGRNIGTP